MDYHEYYKRSFHERGIKVDFVPWDANQMLYSLANEEADRSEAIEFVSVIVKTKGKTSTYEKKLSGMLSDGKYTKFIDKFLTDPEFRKPLLIDGEGWDGTIELKSHNEKLHYRCAEMIEGLNSGKIPRYARNLLSLKSYGMDYYSRLKAPELEKLIDPKHVKRLQNNKICKNEKVYLSALKWCARGLSIDLVLQKVYYDAENAISYVRKKSKEA